MPWMIRIFSPLDSLVESLSNDSLQRCVSSPRATGRRPGDSQGNGVDDMPPEGRHPCCGHLEDTLIPASLAALLRRYRWLQSHAREGSSPRAGRLWRSYDSIWCSSKSDSRRLREPGSSLRRHKQACREEERCSTYHVALGGVPKPLIPGRGQSSE